MKKPDGLSWQHIVNEKGVDMAVINRQSLVDFMLYAEYLQEENDKLKSQSSQGKTVTDEDIEDIACKILDGVEFKDSKAVAKMVYQLTEYLSQFKQVEQTVGEEEKNRQAFSKGVMKSWQMQLDREALAKKLSIPSYHADDSYWDLVPVDKLLELVNTHLTRLKSPTYVETSVDENGSEAVEFAEFILDNEFIKQSDGIQRWWGKRIGEENYSTQELYTLFKDEQQLKGK